LNPFSGLSTLIKPCKTTGWLSAITTLEQCMGNPYSLSLASPQACLKKLLVRQ